MMESNNEVVTKRPIRNCVRIRKLSLFSYYYMYVDNNNIDLACSLFTKYDTPVKFIKKYYRRDSKYAIIYCKINKKDNRNFLKALEELPNKMLLLGNTDYEKFCEFLNNLEGRVVQ